MYICPKSSTCTLKTCAFPVNYVQRVGQNACMLRWWFSLCSASPELRDKERARPQQPRSRVLDLPSPHMMSDWLLKVLSLQKRCQVGTCDSPVPSEKPTFLPVSHTQEPWTKQRRTLLSSFEIYKIKTQSVKKKMHQVQFKSFVLQCALCFDSEPFPPPGSFSGTRLSVWTVSAGRCVSTVTFFPAENCGPSFSA